MAQAFADEAVVAKDGTACIAFVVIRLMNIVQ
jgi:hypothetical protein